MKKLNKRGNVQLVLAGVMTLVLAGFLLIMGLIMLDELLLDTAEVNGATNLENITVVVSTPVNVADSVLCAFNSFSVVEIQNATGFETIDSGNYTTSARAGSVTPVAASEYADDGTWTLNYTYTFGNTEACAASNQTIEAIGNFGDYIDLIVLGIVIAALLSLILVAFSVRKKVR